MNTPQRTELTTEQAKQVIAARQEYERTARYVLSRLTQDPGDYTRQSETIDREFREKIHRILGRPFSPKMALRLAQKRLGLPRDTSALKIPERITKVSFRSAGNVVSAYEEVILRPQTRGKKPPTPTPPAPPKTRRELSISEDELDTIVVELLTKENEEAKEKYLDWRDSLLFDLKAAISADDRASAIQQLDECELWFSKLYKRFQSGRRESELFREQREKHTIEVPITRPKPKQRRRQSSRERTPFKWISFTDKQQQRKRTQEASFAMFRSMLHAHPYKTNDRVDDRIYQTHGTRNPRARKRR